MEESKKCVSPKCTSEVKSCLKKPECKLAQSREKRHKFRWTVSSDDIEHVHITGIDSKLKRKNSGSSSAPPLRQHSIQKRKDYLRADARAPAVKLPNLPQAEVNKKDVHLRASMTESTILEEDVPVIVRRRGCTLRVRITSITDEDLEAFEKECVSLVCIFF